MIGLRIERWTARIASSFLEGPAARLGSPVEVDGQILDPSLALLCRLAGPLLHLEQLGVLRARRRLERIARPLAGSPPAGVTVEERPRRGDLPARRIFCPGTLRRRAVGLYFHSGGWVLGNGALQDGLCGRLAQRLGMEIVSVDYRLAPEHPFPAPLEDARVACDWALERSVRGTDGRGTDGRRGVVLIGESAGANLAAVTAAERAKREHSAIRAQLLFYPVTDGSRDTEAGSYALFARGFGLSRNMMEWFYELYGTAEERRDPRISPLLGESFDGLPPTVLSLAGFDVLRDEGAAYGEALRRAGVRTVCRIHPHLLHGFAAMTELSVCRTAVDEAVDDLERLL